MDIQRGFGSSFVMPYKLMGGGVAQCTLWTVILGRCGCSQMFR